MKNSEMKMIKYRVKYADDIPIEQKKGMMRMNFE